MYISFINKSYVHAINFLFTYQVIVIISCLKIDQNSQESGVSFLYKLCLREHTRLIQLKNQKKITQPKVKRNLYTMSSMFLNTNFTNI